MRATKTWHCDCGEAINPGDEFTIIDGMFLKSGHTHGNTEEEIRHAEETAACHYQNKRGEPIDTEIAEQTEITF